MKVLILTISTGQGHTQTALAISEYFEARGAECRVVDAYKDTNRLLSDSVEFGYLMSTKYATGMYRTGYRMAEKAENSKSNFHLSRLADGVVGQKLLACIREYAPDVIITTHLFAAMHLTYMGEEIASIPTFGVVTDFTMHPYWENTELDYYVTASPLLNSQCVRNGIPEHKILPFGIPVKEKFVNQRSREEARSMLGLSDKTTMMVIWSHTMLNTKSVKQIDSIDADFQILCVCGKNQRAKKDIEALQTGHDIFVYGYIDNVDVLMDASDFMISKPGGITISESLVKAIPVILMNPIPGHEDRNREFLVNNGLSMAVSGTCPVEEAVYQFLHNEWRREHLRDGIRAVSPRNPMKLLYDFIAQRYGKEEERALIAETH